MKTTISNALKAAAFFVMVAVATMTGIMSAVAQPVAMPGSSWASMTFGGPTEDQRGNTVLQGRTEQGADLLKLGSDGKYAVNAYVASSYSLDSHGLDYNNKIAPAVGVRLRRDFADGVADIGIQLVHERRLRSGESGTAVQVYGSYWMGWNAGKK